MQSIHLEQVSGPTVADAAVEIVERKGLGHPDTICDAVMERVSQALSREYLARFGAILHHNCDKGLLVAGQAEHRFGGGKVIEPMRLVFGDRATAVAGGERIDVAGIAVETAKAWFRENLSRVDPDRHLRYQVELKPGSEQLTGLFREAGSAVLGANDTSAAVGYAPLTETERVVLETERYLNSRAFKERFPESGEDVKVMGVRTGRKLALTVSMPLLDRFVPSEADYFRQKRAALDDLEKHLSRGLQALDEVSVDLNALDREGGGIGSMYLSVLGTSAEGADSGEVGRGNQVNGLIALHRPRGSEAAAGKNPVSHVGKIYSVLSHLLAAKLHGTVPGLRQVTVWLQSRIGDPINRPAVLAVEAHLEPGRSIAELSGSMRRIIEEGLERMPEFCKELAAGAYKIC